MKKLLLIFFSIALHCPLIYGQTEWTGPPVIFTKAPFADWTLPANQDIITPNVSITRANTQGIFNITQEASYNFLFSPADTEWAMGTIAAGVGTLSFSDWESTIGSCPPCVLTLEMVLHLITDDIYIDIVFTQWGQGAPGGGSFSYTRSTDNALSIGESELPEEIKVFPNPSNGIMEISSASNLNISEAKVYNILGQQVYRTVSETNNLEQLDISSLDSGVYLIEIITENGSTIKRIIKQ